MYKILSSNVFKLTIYLGFLTIPILNIQAQFHFKRSVFFSTNSFALDTVQSSKLKFSMDSIFGTQKYNFKKMDIIGYCDDRGSLELNKLLSINRANAAMKTLLTFSSEIDISKVSTSGKGKISSAPNLYFFNRRVDILLNFDNKPTSTFSSEVIGKDYNKESKALKFEGADFKDLKVGDKILFDNLLFFGGRHFLYDESIPQLRELLAKLEAHPKIHIKIYGHICCEPAGPNDGLDFDTQEYNLSKARAKNIYNFLVSKGINPDRLAYEGLGANFKLGKGDKYDRRVEAQITKIDP